MDAHYTIHYANNEGRCCIDPKQRYVETPGAVYNMAEKQRHMTAPLFSKQGSRFPKQKLALDPPIVMNAGTRHGTKKQAKGGCFSKASRFGAGDGMGAGNRARVEMEKAAAAARKRQKEARAVTSHWNLTGRPVHTPLRMHGMRSKTPGLDNRNGRNPPRLRRTMFTDLQGRSASLVPEVRHADLYWDQGRAPAL